MENSWQIKCGSTFPSSSTPSMAPSSMDHRDQMNTGYYSYPHPEADLRSMVLGRMEDSVFSNSVSFSIHKTGRGDLGNSFLALLSGPPSLLQCDFQEFSHPKSSSSSGKLPSNVSSFSVNAVGSDIPLISSRLLSENLSNQNLRNGADFGPVFSSRAMVNSNSSNSVLHDLQGSELTKAVVSHIIPCNEKVKDPSLNGECYVTNPADTRKLSSGNVQSSQNVPLEANSSSSKQPSAFMSGCPRVFCLDKSGHLLLSNTGLLGIVCSCHYFHMSVSKFCEHSGLCDVNAGDVVHMDSGETIAQWRKFYFQKFRIRVPEDQSEWDWPEGLSVTGGFAKSSVTLPNLCKSSDFSHRFGSSGGLVRSGQPLDHALFPKNHPEQNLLIDALQNKKQRNIPDVDNFLLKSSIGSSCSNLDSVVDNQIMECPVSRSSTVQKFVSSGLDKGRQSISACIDSVMKNGKSSISSTLQNVRELGKDSDVSRNKNAKENVIVGRDAASSNIELRLGQPYQPSRTSGNSILPVIGPQKFDKLLDPPNMCFRRPMIHNAANYTEEDYRQYRLCAADPFSYSAEKEPSQLSLGNHAIGSISAMNARLEKSKVNAANSSVVLPFSDFTTATEGAHSKANVDIVNGDGHLMTRALHHESQASECDQFTFCWNGGNGLERQLNISQLDSLRLMDKGKAVGRVSDVPCISKDALFGNLKPVENSVLGGSSEPCFSAVNNKSCYSRLPFSVVPDASDSRNLSGYVEKVPCLGSSGQGDHAVLRSNFPLQGISMGFPLVSSTSTLDTNPAFMRQEGFGASPYLLDDNLRLLALRQIMELSKQQHALTSVINQEQGKYGSSSHIHHSLVDASTSPEQRHGPNLTSKRDVSEASMNFLQSAAALRMGDDKKKVASVTGNLLHPDGTDLPYQLSDDPIQNERPSLRLGRGDKNMSTSSERESFCQRVPYTCYQGKCNCEAPKNYPRNFDSKVGSSPSAFKEQMGTGSIEASMIFNSKYANNQVLLKDLTTSLDQNDKLSRQLHKNMVCHAFQWRDVPSKVKGVCDAAVVDQSANVLDQIEHDGSQLGDNSAKCFNKVMQIVDYLKDQEKSNVSSGDSAPAVTYASIEVNNIDFSTVDAWDTGYGSNHIVDEGSGIDRCWSSDDALGSERSAEFLGSTFKANSRKEGSSHIINNQPPRSLLDELKIIDSLTWKKGRNQIHSGLAIHGKSAPQKSKTGLQMGKRKRAIQLKMLSESCSPAGPSLLPDDNPKHNITELPTCLSKNMQMLIPSGQGTSHSSGACFIRPSSKQRLSCKRGAREDDYQTELFGDTDFCKKPEVSGRKKLRTDLTSDVFRQFWMQEPIHEVADKTEKHKSVGCTGTSSSRQVNMSYRNARPVVIGKYGEISGRKDVLKPAKLVSLSGILKTARRCALPKNCKPRPTSMRELKKIASTPIDLCYTKFIDLKDEGRNGSHNATVCDKLNWDTSIEETDKAWFNGDEKSANKLPNLEKVRDNVGQKDRSILGSNVPTHLNLKCKEIRKRSIYELTVEGQKSTTKAFPFKKVPKCTPEMKVQKISKNTEESSRALHRIYSSKSMQEHRCLPISYSDAFCCVCGSSNQDDINCLLECSRCLIRVHQACYGISKVPKGCWYCRPCRTSSKDIVCVLCGYGGGAMTRALQSRTIVKGILKAWNIGTVCRHGRIYSAESLQNESNALHFPGSELERNFYPVLQPVNIKSSAIDVRKMEIKKQLDVQQDSLCCVSNLKVHNSITAGVHDSTVKQWVHMVCGLWTPGTRCPNVDTMTAFDVSGASRPKANVVCSMCNRPGGSCIQCRVVNCCIQFHPWCAHQKGLLQSEVEGADNENVGFYGRCVLHASCPITESSCDVINGEIGGHGENELTCARTEGYKGRKHDDPLCDLYGKSKGKGGCLVPQEQLNAWIHINTQKSTHGLPKLPNSDIEYDCRKEYARYKLAKGWKRLVVYKSGIHALGLYTSRFISRSEMVVEYVGEIVGLRVADKRENEYQSGRKLQYKSACYFFRIDKEHIIDATCKGGIARFVNHSCLPNCVAKVISVRNEKKVVFFAERDIFPGEEITYDYHFNHEDEGKKIPCFCSSKNCRRYLN